MEAEAIMIKGGVGRRYAQAIFDIAVERKDFDRWLGDLANIREFLTMPQVALVMENPGIALEDKKQLADKVLVGLDPPSRNLVYLLISKRRTEIIETISAEFENMVNEHHGVAYADVTTAVQLSEIEETAVASKLSEITGKRVQLRISVDPSIIGGVVARIGDRLIDGSVKGRLSLLRQRLMGAAV